MIKYWPYKQGIDLNNEVANLFFSTRQKFSYALLNKTNNLLCIDILDNYGRSVLFSVILMELEKLILDIIELDLNLKNIKQLNSKILYDLMQKSLDKFSSKFNFIDNINIYIKKNRYLKNILFENKLLLEYMLTYFIFGSYYIENNIFAFDNILTPKEHVAILFENLVIQISNIVMFLILENMSSLINIANFIHKNKLCNYSYLSIRSIALFRNSLFLQNLIDIYINKPKQIYSSRHKVLLLSANGILSKYIYISRYNDFIALSKFQLVFIFLIEVQDLLIPQIERFLLILTKVILYIIINFIGNSAIFCIRVILSSFNNIYL
uniref:Ycf55 n=1 Tax=Leiomenia cribrosa TaxID=217483 RepID=A0A4D6WVB2_9FLOR|nr:hypothetical protein [Leiomenia cribrosa]